MNQQHTVKSNVRENDAQAVRNDVRGNKAHCFSELFSFYKQKEYTLRLKGYSRKIQTKSRVIYCDCQGLYNNYILYETVVL